MTKRPSDSRIDHAKIIDGFGELVGKTHYEAREVHCGRCGVRFVFAPRDQKYVHEVRGVPIKMATRRAAYCAACVPLRAAENRAHRRERAAAEAHTRALAAIEATPRSCDAILHAVETGLAKHALQPTRRGAEKLVALARRAGRVEPTRIEWKFWEAQAQLAAGQGARARVSFAEFIAEAEGRVGLSRLVREAKLLSSGE